MSDLGLLTKKEAAEFLRVSISTIEKLRYDGSIPFVKLGKRVFFKKTALADYVERQQFTYANKETSDG